MTLFFETNLHRQVIWANIQQAFHQYKQGKYDPTNVESIRYSNECCFYCLYISLHPYWRWVGLWGFLWWAPSAKRKGQRGVNSGWNSTWFHSNTGLSGTQYEQSPIVFWVWSFWLTPFFFQSITYWRVYGWIVFHLLKLLSFVWPTYCCSIGPCFSVKI